MKEKLIPRPEHPRPDFMRDTFYNLNGQWQFAFDDENAGVKQGWFRPGHPLERQITVPFCYQCKASGVDLGEETHPVLWYRRSFTVPAEMAGRRILLRFGAVDYKAQIYVNGQLAGSHIGGYTPFALDITDFLTDGENDLCVRVEDYPDPIQPRGKQNWNDGLMGCWYTPTSGIWQTVYLEAVGDTYAEYIHITPDIDAGTARVEVMLNRIPEEEITVSCAVSMNGKPVRKVTSTTCSRSAVITVDLNTNVTHQPVALWTQQKPALYDVQVQILSESGCCDRVDTYFGMRKIEVKDGVVYLNNRRLYQRLVLDQGYWPDTLITPPSDEAIREDLQWTVKLGYNGARKHQKIEDPRYYYWADKMGVLVWGEVPSAYAYTDETVENLCRDMLEFIRRDFNHPSIIAWVPLNESWGVPQIVNSKRQQMTASMLYHMAKAADGTRLCSGNDGWEQVHTDICGVHDYSADKAVLESHFASREYVESQTCDTHRCYADGFTPSGKEAFMVTEYGGIAFMNIGLQGQMGGMQTWGYRGKVTDEEAFFARFKIATDAIVDTPYIQGYCYTQLTDVMQEINGLLTPDRKPKMDADRLRGINRNPNWHAERDLLDAAPTSWG